MISNESNDRGITATAKKKVMIVDDHPVVRQGLRSVIDWTSDLMVCGEAQTVYDALQCVERLRPDVVAVDLSLGAESGMDLVKDLRIRHPEVRVLVLSVHDEGIYAERMLRAGASGYLSKAEGPESVLKALRTVLAGEVFLSDRMAGLMLSKLAGHKAETGGLSIERLSDRELQVYELIGKGMGTREIAETLHLSVKTVESHRANIKEKLQIETATELLQHAIHWVQSQS